MVYRNGCSQKTRKVWWMGNVLLKALRSKTTYDVKLLECYDYLSDKMP
jgi:hypothetical protein